MVPRIVRIDAVCGTLFRTLLITSPKGEVHSVFERAVNLDTDIGMISILCKGRGLQPFSCRTAEMISFLSEGIHTGDPVKADGEGIWIGEDLYVSLSGVQQVDMSVAGAFPSGCFAEVVRPDPEPLLKVLRVIGDENGLSNLAVDLPGNVYADLINPRLPELYRSIEAKDPETAERAAERIAGCGIGLTPSSDDLLNGFFSVMQVKAQAEEDYLLSQTISRAAVAAAGKTNRISGTFLLQVSKGQISEDVLHLLKLLFYGSDADLISKAAFRVASFGSTSGTDTLTGIVLAIIHTSIWREK